MPNKPTLKKYLEEHIPGVNVYIQPPASVLMHYPAIRCELNDVRNTSADDIAYKQDISHTLTYISNDAYDPNILELAKLPYCSFSRAYVSDELYHTIFILYY